MNNRQLVADRNRQLAQLLTTGAITGKLMKQIYDATRGGKKKSTNNTIRTITRNINAGRAIPLLKDAKSLKTKVRNLQAKAKATEATHTHRTQETNELVCTAGECTYASYVGSNQTMLETALANLRFYDATTAALITNDGTSGTFSRQYMFDKMVSSIECANTYNYPVNVKVYACTPKEDTSLSPRDTLVNSIADMGVGLDIDDIQLFPTDCSQFKKIWKINKSYSRKLKPGQNVTFSHKMKNFNYDPSDGDSHALAYQKQQSSIVWLVRIEGILCHNTSGVPGFAACSLDTNVKTKYRVTYDAGVALEDYSTSQTVASPVANLAIVNPVVAFQGFSDGF